MAARQTILLVNDPEEVAVFFNVFALSGLTRSVLQGSILVLLCFLAYTTFLQYKLPSKVRTIPSSGFLQESQTAALGQLPSVLVAGYAGNCDQEPVVE